MAEVDVILSIQLLDHWQALILSTVLKVENGALGAGAGHGQLSSFVCLTLAKDRFSFLSLKSQDNSRRLKLFLAQPLAQTPGACEMGVGQRGGTNTGIAEKRPPPHLLASLWLPFSWMGESVHFFSLLVDSGHPAAVVTSIASGGWWQSALRTMLFFSQIFKPFKCWGFFEFPLYPLPHCPKRTNLLALYI